MNYFLAPENLHFSVAIVVMFGLAAVETLAVLLGGGASHLLDSFFHHELHLDADGHAPGVLGWLHFGRVPMLVLVIIFLTAFGVSGLLIQSMVRSLLGSALPSLIAAVPAFLLAIPTVRVLGGLFAKIIPKDETTAVSQDSLIGRIATIVSGTAARDEPAEARLKDQHGQEHYVMVEPDIDGEHFHRGTDLLLVKRNNSIYRAIRNPSAALVDH